MIQQTPKPNPQPPEASPPASEHSLEVLQIPVSGFVPCPVHWLFGNCTTVNSENCSAIIKV